MRLGYIQSLIKYHRKEDLPDGLRNSLPVMAQEIYLRAYNRTLEKYGPRAANPGVLISLAHRIAWSAVKRRFEKDPYFGRWHKLGRR